MGANQSGPVTGAHLTAKMKEGNDQRARAEEKRARAWLAKQTEEEKKKEAEREAKRLVEEHNKQEAMSSPVGVEFMRQLELQRPHMEAAAFQGATSFPLMRCYWRPLAGQLEVAACRHFASVMKMKEINQLGIGLEEEDSGDFDSIVNVHWKRPE